MESVWSASCEFPKRESLECDLSTDVAVIGAGIAGILTAYLLREKGLEVVLLEAAETADGMTKNTTAKITSQHDLFYDKLIKSTGAEKAGQYAAANQAAVDKYAEIIQQNQLDCSFEWKSAYVYSLGDTGKIEREVDAAKKLGIEAEFTTQTKLPFQVSGAVRFPNQAQFNPLKFLKPLAEKLTIYEHTTAREVKDHTIATDNGKVTAKSIVVATHYPFINTPGYYFARMHQERSYVIALENAPQIDGMYIDADKEGYSFRNYEDLLLLGGASHRTGKNHTGGCYENLRNRAKEWYPNATEKYFWSAQDCMPLDNIPYIGKFSESTPDLYVATGFKKWGMTSAMVSAMILSDKIAGFVSDYEEVFSPNRFHVSASIKNLIVDGAESVAGLVNEVFNIPGKDLENIQNGHGGVVEYEGQKVGVYKNEHGEAFVVTTKCPHLGCKLAWNPDELTWECPCHGSRFDYKGNMINNPAMRGLKRE